MSAATAAMTAGFGAQMSEGVFGILRGFESAAAQREQARFAEAQFNIAARMSELQEKDVLRTGEEQAAQIRKQSKRLAGAQRTAIAAQNIDVFSGSAAQARQDIELFSDLDEITVRDMAWQRAFGLRVQASDMRMQALFRRQAGEFAASQSILSGVASALGSFSRAGFALSQGFPSSSSGRRPLQGRSPLALTTGAERAPNMLAGVNPESLF